MMVAAQQMIAGGILLALGGLAMGESAAWDAARVSTRSLAAFVYLTLIGSLVGFSAYAWLLKHFEPTLVATHTYVNPIVAVLLGWALAGEKLTGSILLSMGLAILAISLVNRGSRTP